MKHAKPRAHRGKSTLKPSRAHDLALDALRLCGWHDVLMGYDMYAVPPTTPTLAPANTLTLDDVATATTRGKG